MAFLSRHSILACIGIALIVSVGSVTAAVPQACAQCSSETYPGSDICPRACRIVFPADTEWTYPEAVVVAEEEETEDEFLFGNITSELLASRFLHPDGMEAPDLAELIESRFG